MVYEGYGLTEASPTTHSTPTLAKRKIGSIGLPMTGTECKIVDLEKGEREVPLGEDGELCIRGPQVMKGYWNKPEETDLALRDGWLYTEGEAGVPQLRTQAPNLKPHPFPPAPERDEFDSPKLAITRW